jgi:tetratricopeptide (TPR) repeat protein
MEVLKNEIPLEDNLSKSIDFFNKKPYQVYKEWLDTHLKINKGSPVSDFMHLSNFLKKHSTDLGLQKYFYMEKIFYLSVELRLFEVSKRILTRFTSEFGKEPKIIRMEAYFLETHNERHANMSYKKLIEHNQEDRTSLKKYIAFIKPLYNVDNIKKYIEIWNEYLKVYMDDYDGWFELSDVYLMTNNFNKAIFCLEEILLHQPNNFDVYTKIGDILCSLNNSDSANNAVKYYSQSILIKPTPRAFWGLVYSINIIHRANKTLEAKNKNLLKIATVNLEEMYKDSPFKILSQQFYDIKSD